MNVKEHPIYAIDGTIWGICQQTKGKGDEVDIKVVTKSRNKTISLNYLMYQAYNPTIANQRRSKVK